ncbi:MAG: hypothetical protein ACYCY9_15010 [Thiobacillus sp.]
MPYTNTAAGLRLDWRKNPSVSSVPLFPVRNTRPSLTALNFMEFHMDIGLFIFDCVHRHGASATHPLARPGKRLPLSLVVALKDSDPLRAEARVESYAGIGLLPLRFAAAIRPDAPSAASNHGL